jgi:hypothetical protein
MKITRTFQPPGTTAAPACDNENANNTMFALGAGDGGTKI